ncbi:kinetochore protein Spc24 isoform X1 [Ictidomys tridecemlineatus]|uniref:Kinetochore protein Spc24 n=1 Tax=Ictidomys tridecemlineatus TaxID=43179 RepID=I3MAV4_ICTTR|nr:kinetochore protein Spc24 isoform X1 [Ictidomys tridecemlineatus]KAG3280282.1 SPC24, NDC80 kinetochore complex component [Ictidomys tridecemlineatus]
MAAFRDIEEVSQGLLSLLSANRAEAQQRRLLGRHEQILERLLETQDGAEQRLQETLATEEEVAQSLLHSKERSCQGNAELQQLEAELQRAAEDDAHLQASLLQLTGELEELRELEADLERQERDVDEDTTVVIPSAVYVAQLYHRMSKIEWDYESEPGVIKGIHYGPSVAQPIHLDSTQLSQKFISDYLWSLVDTEWQPGAS